MDQKKKILILAPLNACGYKEIFPYIKDSKLWLGYSYGKKWFRVPDYYSFKGAKTEKIVDGHKFAQANNVIWLTNLEVKQRRDELVLYRRYNSSDYPKYENLDGIEVSRVVEIPQDYDGLMGVPLSFLCKHNPDQFEIIHFRKGNDGRDLRIAGRQDPYIRLIIRKKGK